MKRRNLIIIAAAALGLAAAGLSVAALESGQANHLGRAHAVTSVIVLEPHLAGETLAPPPANASPALTARQAAVKGLGLPADAMIPSYVSAQLGLFTLPVGPRSSCRNDCSGDTFVNGIAYSSYRVLVYAFSRSECSDGSLDVRCAEWDFIDANTGKYIAGIIPRP